MIVTEIYNGQGLGNQLACYVTTRVVAADKGFSFGIMNPHKFKCLDFMDLDFGESVIGGEGPEGGPPSKLPDGIQYYFQEWWKHCVLPDGSNITTDDPGLEQIQDNTKIDGIFQSENRIIHRKEEIKQWLKVKPEVENYQYSDDDTCVINFRGGIYKSIPAFYLRNQYWIDSVNHMKKVNPKMKFVVISDDIGAARGFFPSDFFVQDSSKDSLKDTNTKNIGNDYSIIKNAVNLILSNSSFPYFPTLTSETIKLILAPKYWGRHNVSDGYWSCGYNIYRNHTYVDREGKLFSYDECVREFEGYKKHNPYFRKNTNE